MNTPEHKVMKTNNENTIVAIEKAMVMVSDLCKPKGSEGSRCWLMSIPARPDHDPDLVIADALIKSKETIESQQSTIDAQRAEIERLSKELKRFEGCVPVPVEVYSSAKKFIAHRTHIETCAHSINDDAPWVNKFLTANEVSK